VVGLGVDEGALDGGLQLLLLALVHLLDKLRAFVELVPFLKGSRQCGLEGGVNRPAHRI
jgi:hypothetical protein